MQPERNNNPGEFLLDSGSTGNKVIIKEVNVNESLDDDSDLEFYSSSDED